MARMRRMGRQQGDTPTRQPIDMAPDFRAGPYKPLPITPDYERSIPSPLPIPPGYERGPYKPLPLPPFNPGPGPMPMPFEPPFTPEEFNDYFKNRRRGFNTSETARENFISRTDGGYPSRQDPSFMDRYGMDKYGDYINRGLDYMPSPIGVGSRILRGLGSLYGGNAGNAAEYIEELPVTPLQGDNFDDEVSGIMGAMPQERQMAGLTQTWQKIFENVGEDAANKWLASQQAAVPMAT
jgi:hypothetical protein